MPRILRVTFTATFLALLVMVVGMAFAQNFPIVEQAKLMASDAGGW